MQAIFSRRVVVTCSLSQLTKPVTKQPSQRHFLSHLLPYGLCSSSVSSSATRFVPSFVPRLKKSRGFFASTLGNTYLKQTFGNVFESRVRFFSSQLPSYGFESKGFTGFQKRVWWKSWINGTNGVVLGLIITNAAVYTMWKVSDNKWMVQNFVLSTYSFTTGRLHTLITSGFSHMSTSHIILNMIQLSYFGTRIGRTLGPLYLLKLYFAGALGGSVSFLSVHALLATLKGQGVVPKDQSRFPTVQLGATGSVYAIALLDMFIYPKVTTYFSLILRAPVIHGILFFGLDMLKMLEGRNNNITTGWSPLGGAVVAVMAWAQIKKGRF